MAKILLGNVKGPKGDTGPGGTVDYSKTVPVLTSTGDTTDRLAEIQALLDSNGYVKLGMGEFYLSGQLRIGNGATLDGYGKATVIKQTPDSTQPSMIWLKSEGTIRNVCLQGEWTDTPTPETAKSSSRIGIVISGGTNNAIIDGCWICGWTGQGVLASTNSMATRSFLMSNCDVRWNNVGLKTEESEYACITGCTFRNNITGVLNNGGNNKFVSCGIDSNYDGFVINHATNNGHGSCNGCTLNHNTHYAVNMAYTEFGFVFSGCNFAEGTIRNTQSKGIMFSGCRFGNWLKYNNYTANATLFSGCIFSHSPQTESDEWLDSYNGYKFINCFNYNTGESVDNVPLDDIPKLGYSTPEMYDAIGDGVNDDAGAFTNAINDSDYVFLTSDLYLFTPVAITGKTRLVIDGNGYTINCKNIERAFQITDSTNIVFRNIIFDGNSCTTQGVTFINCENIQVEKCTFKNMTTTSATDGETWGLNFRDSKDMRVDFCSFLNIDGSGNSTKVANGIVVHGHTKGCENITISNCYFDTILPVTDACGISLNQTNFYDTPLHGVVENCRFIDCAKRAVKIMAQHVTVKNCDIKDVLSTDVHASMIDIMASHCRVANNTINVNSATYGISCQYVAVTSTITGFTDIVIENNYIYAANTDSTTARDGLTVGIVNETKLYENIVVKNNIVKGAFRYAFKAMYIANSVIDGNTFEGEIRVGNRSLNDRPCSNNRMVNNTMKGTLEFSVAHSLLAHNEFVGNGGFGIYYSAFTNGSPSNLRIIGNNFNNLSYGIHAQKQALDNVIITDNIFTDITASDMLLNGTNYAVANNVLCKGVTGTFEVIPENINTSEPWTFTIKNDDGSTSTVTKAVHVG